MIGLARLRQLSVTQVRLLLGVIGIAAIGVAAYVTFHHKVIVSDFPAPNCTGTTCTETVTSSDALVGNGGYGGAYGPISHANYPGQYAAGGGGQTDLPLPNGGCDGNGDHYDGNFWGVRGQTNTFGTSPVWWYSPPTAVGTGRNCENQWGAPAPPDAHKSYKAIYGSNNNKNNQSLNEDPAAFLDPGGSNGDSALQIGWASDPDFTAGKSTWPNALKAQNVDSGTPATSAWANGANFITCANCTNNSSGQTFVYRTTFDTLDPDLWDISSVSLRYIGSSSSWAAAWIDSSGGMTTDTTINKSSDAGNETPFPCQNDGVCPIFYNDTNGDLTGPNGAGPELELGVGQTDCGNTARCGPLATILSKGTRHVLAIQGSAKSYACQFGVTTGCNTVTNTPAVAFWLQIKYTKAAPKPAVSFKKDFKSVSSGLTSGGVPELRPGTGDTVDFTNSATFTLDPTDTSRAIHYTISDPNPTCLTINTGGNSSSGNFTLNQSNSPVTVKWDAIFKVNNTCPNGDNQYTNTATISWNETDDRTWTGSRSDTFPYLILTPYYPWIQTQFGDVHSNGDIITNPGSVASYVVSAGGNINGFNSTNCLVFLSSSCSNTIGSYGTLPWPWQQNASFFSDLAANPVTATLTSGAIPGVEHPNVNVGNGSTSEFYTVPGCTVNIGNITVRGAVTIYVPCANATVNVTGTLMQS